MTENNINSAGPAIPLAPPPPPQIGSGTWKQPVNDYSGSSGTKSGRIEIEGNQVPSVLASAFNNPQNKNKKPFSYFLGGQPPDLSEKPSPSSVKSYLGSLLGQTQDSPQPVVHRNIPKVLPLVSDDEYENSKMPVAHLQYNSPMPLYSQSNASEALRQQTGSAIPMSQGYEPGRSGTYALVHEIDEGRQLPPEHSVRLDEPHGEEYPHWHGYTNPDTQSPSLRRLRNATYMHENGQEDSLRADPLMMQGVLSNGRRSRSHEQDDQRRFMGIERQDMNPSPTFHHLQRATGTADTGSWRETYMTRDVCGGPFTSFGRTATNDVRGIGIQHQPAASQSYSAQDLRMSSRTPTWAEMETGVDHQQVDPEFAQKIAEAERPKVPAGNEPVWASSALQKHSKWQHQAVHVPEPQRFDLDRANWENRALQKQQKWQPLTEPVQPRQFVPVQPPWAHKAEEKRNKWESASGYDPAQNPRQFAPETPYWANKAEQKQSRWSSIGDPLDQRSQQFGAHAHWTTTAQSKSDKWQDHYGSLERGREFNRSPLPPLYSTQPQETFTSGPVLAHSPMPYSSSARGRRGKSHDPSEWRTHEKEPWMKPYIAPNVEHTKFGPSPDYGYSGRPRSTEPHHEDRLRFGLYYGTQDRRRLARSHSYTTMKTTSNRGVPHPVFKRGSHVYGGTDYTAEPDVRKKIAPEAIIIGTAERSGRIEQPTPVWRDGGAQSSVYTTSQRSQIATQVAPLPPAPKSPSPPPKPSPKPQRILSPAPAPMAKIEESELEREERLRSVREKRSMFESMSSSTATASSKMQQEQTTRQTVHGIADYKPLYYGGEESTTTRYETHQPRQEEPSWTYTATQKQNQISQQNYQLQEHNRQEQIRQQQQREQQLREQQIRQQQQRDQQMQQQQREQQMQQQQREQQMQQQREHQMQLQREQQMQQQREQQMQLQQRQQQTQIQQRKQHEQWQHEQDAARQRREMEKEIERRYQEDQMKKKTQQSQSSYSTSQRQSGESPLQVQTYTTGGKKQWESAPGASTKSHMAGDYLDPEGNKVSYTKEVYTSTDPGKEFSMLTEQEKRVTEEPLSPGVISRHVKTKYYKKSTYTSQTTTSTSQAPPVASLAGRTHQLAIGPPPSSHGVSSF